MSTPFERLKLAEIAKRIDEHLKRFEADPSINKLSGKSHIHPYFNAGAGDVGAYVSISYVSFQGHHNLRKSEALDYLRWLDEGHVGKHWAYLRRTA